jgi:hypothetical protein
VAFVILENGIRCGGQPVTIGDIRISVYRHHLGPSVEVLLLFGRELVLIVLGPAMEIRHVPENEGAFRWRISAIVLFRLKGAAGGDG